MAGISGRSPDRPRPTERASADSMGAHGSLFGAPYSALVRITFACTLALGAAPGCGLLFPQRPTSSNTPAHAPVLVSVESHNWSDITVYLVAGGLPQRLGMVSALGEATFDFSSQRLNTSGGVRLRALPMAGQPFTSETILVVPGQAIFWTLENNLETSSFTVY
jgi:hypothetical protein